MSDKEILFRSYMSGAIGMFSAGLMSASIPLTGQVKQPLFLIGLLIFVASFKFFPNPLLKMTATERRKLNASNNYLKYIWLLFLVVGTIAAMYCLNNNIPIRQTIFVSATFMFLSGAVFSFIYCISLKKKIVAR